MSTVRVLIVIALAIITGSVAYWLLTRDDDDEGGGATPVASSVSDLRSLARTAGHPVYWAGPMKDVTYELTETGGGNIFIRYLTGAAEIGDTRPLFLTVGTYPLEDAVGALRRTARNEGAVTRKIERGGLAVTNRGQPTSVYFAFPGEDIQIEVFDPNPARALDLATSGDVRPID